MNVLFDRVFYNSDLQSEINATGIKDDSEHGSTSSENTYLIEEVKCQRKVTKNDRAYDAALEKKKSRLSSKAFKMDVKTNFLKSESANLQKEIEDLGAILIEILSERDQAALDLDEAKDESKLLEDEILAMQMEIEEVKYFNEISSTLAVDQMKMYNQMLLFKREQEMLEMRKMTLEIEELKQTFMAVSLDKKQTNLSTLNQKLEIDKIDKKSRMLSYENDELHNIIRSNSENKAGKSITMKLNGVRLGFDKLLRKKKKSKRKSITEFMIEKQRNSYCESFDRHRKSFVSTIDTVKNGEYIDIPRVVQRRLSFAK